MITVWVVFRPPFFASEVSFVSQAPDYVPQVESLLAGEGFGSFRYPPVFPLFLAGVSWASQVADVDDAWLGALWLLVFATSGSVLMFLLGRHLWGSRWGLFCVVAWLSYPVFWRLWLQPLSEAPFVVVLLAAVVMMLRSGEQDRGRALQWTVTGLMLGLAMLIRPSGIGLPIVFGLFVLARMRVPGFRRQGITVALVMLGALLAILPWQLHIWRVSGQIIPLSTGGVPTILDGLTYAVDPSENRPVWVPDSVRRLQWEIYDKSYGELNNLSTMAGFLAEKLRQTPGAVVQLFAIKAARAWYGTDSGAGDLWLLLFQIPAVAMLLAGMARTCRHSRPTRDAGALIAMIVLYFWALSTVALSIVRYMVPALALMVVTLPALRMLPVAENSKASD